MTAVSVTLMTAVSLDLAGYPARYFAAWSQRDLAVALAVIAEDVHWQDPSLPEPITDHERRGGILHRRVVRVSRSGRFPRR